MLDLSFVMPATMHSAIRSLVVCSFADDRLSAPGHRCPIASEPQKTGAKMS